MSTITTINGSDTITSSRTVLNANMAALNTDKIETSVLDTDTALTANSDSKVATQKAVKAYVDASPLGNASTTVRGVVEEATQAEVSAGAATGGSGARLFINPSTSTTGYSTTQVFTGTAPTAYTDLDLSSVVGTKQRVVMLAVTNGGGASEPYSFIRKGSSYTTGVLNPNGVSAVNVANGKTSFVIVTTDTSGVIQWTGDAAPASTVINVEAYW
jgi:hypothetical protein